jgi:hypothetical protein
MCSGECNTATDIQIAIPASADAGGWCKTTQHDFCALHNDTLSRVCADVAIKNPIKVTAAKLLLPSILRLCEMQFVNLNYV